MFHSSRVVAALAAPLFVLLLSLNADAAQLTGRVVDANGNPLPHASVVTNRSGLGTMTDDSGLFSLDIDEDVTRVTFSVIGYQSRQYSVGNLPDPVMLRQSHIEGEGILVRSDRAVRGISAIAFDNVTSERIERDLTATEFPLLLQSTPNLLAYTDGGASLGYSYFKIRGFDDQRIATYINGVPLNDPEDHFTYFVDIPDFGANVSDVQVQRGVGNSLYGDASFGGSVNIVSTLFDKGRVTRLLTGYGEFTRNGEFVGKQVSKQSLEYASGLVDGRWAFYGRFSRQHSSGYRDLSWYKGWSYYLSAGRLDDNMVTEVHLYGGPINSHLAYRGLSKEEIESDRTAAYDGQIYANETDNFNQPHYQLHNTYFVNDAVTLHNTLYYIRGKGYFEQRRLDEDYANYNLTALSDSASGDVIRQKWVFKNQVGWTPRLDMEHAKGMHTFGGSVYFFESDHWGQVVSAEHLNRSVDPTHRYYTHRGEKWVASVLAQEKYDLFGSRVGLIATAQLRYSKYKFAQERIGAFKGHEYDLDYLFFSPRLGVSWRYSPSVTFYTSFGITSRAPNDYNIYDAADPEKFPQLEIVAVDSISNPGDTVYTFGDATVESERVYDLEVGGEYRAARYNVGANLFLMRYDNHNIFEGDYDDQWRPITINLDRSTHSGLELSAAAIVTDSLSISGNFSYNYNRIDRFEAYGFDFSGNKVPGFPDFIGNAIIDYHYRSAGVSFKSRYIGKQYMDPANSESLVIDPVMIASILLSYEFRNFISLGKLELSVHVDNVFDKKYIASGIGGNWNDGSTVPATWAEYFVAPERSFYGQVSLEMF